MRTVIGFLFTLFSYLFHLILSLFLIGISIVALSSGHALDLEMLPWTGIMLTRWVLGLGAIGLLLVLLYPVRIFRYLFPLWTVFAFWMILRGFFLTPYNFGGEAQFEQALGITAGAFVSFLGSLAVYGSRRRRARI